MLAAPLNECHAKMCKVQKKAAEANKAKIEAYGKELLKEYTAGKCTLAELKTKLIAMKADVMKTKASQDMMKCAVENCHMELKMMLTEMMNMINKGCERSPDQCTPSEIAKLNKLVAKKSFSLKDYNVFMQTIMKNL